VEDFDVSRKVTASDGKLKAYGICELTNKQSYPVSRGGKHVYKETLDFRRLIEIARESKSRRVDGKNIGIETLSYYLASHAVSNNNNNNVFHLI
jgi:hypothetical protein